MEYKDHHILRLIHFDNLEDTHRKYFYLKETIRLISGFESTLALEVLASVEFHQAQQSRDQPGGHNRCHPQLVGAQE